MKNYLTIEELYLAKPKFRKIVLEAWARGESVPYGITAVSDEPISDQEFLRMQNAIKKYNLDKLD